MRIGIITIQKCDNFGADLQAYALGAKLRSLWYEAENIDYLFYKHPRHLKLGGMEKPVLPISLVNKVKEKLFPVLQAIKGKKNSSAVRERHQRFDEWFRQNVKVGLEYRSVKSLYDDPPKYDVYMVGSDQVWNPRMGSNIKPYFGDFAPKDARCVSYAASIGAELQRFWRYLALAGVVLLGAYLLTKSFCAILPSIPVVVLKVLVDLIMFLLGYFVQRTMIFGKLN